jgi:broad specificity phosphatase PhoE
MTSKREPADLMAPQTIVYLVRHGESAGNLNPAARRSDDPPLTERGRAQAARAAAALVSRGLRAVFSSPLRRARETAGAVAAAAGVPVRAADGFGEVDMGALADPETAEGRAEREALFAAWLAGDRRRAFPGGEDFASVTRRVRDGLASVAGASSGGPVAVVTHRMALVAAAELCAPPGAPLDGGGCPNGSITTLESDRSGGWRLVAWADAGHLA